MITGVKKLPVCGTGCQVIADRRIRTAVFLLIAHTFPVILKEKRHEEAA